MSQIFRRFEQLMKQCYTTEYQSGFLVMSMGIRSDGVKVFSSNGAAKFSKGQDVKIKVAHAEQRLCRKLDKGAEVYVARVHANGNYALAASCITCRRTMKARGVSRVFYTIGPNEYGVIDFEKD
jgi:phosphoribosylformylglycinamidine (FGAM) synthase-like amidotransferase family enzyme